MTFRPYGTYESIVLFFINILSLTGQKRPEKQDK
jgi:hypothetical protein